MSVPGLLIAALIVLWRAYQAKNRLVVRLVEQLDANTRLLAELPATLERLNEALSERLGRIERRQGLTDEEVSDEQLLSEARRARRK
ncbi:MAG: hypothetical protein K2X35_09580 [Bryobacteraceae bacterium]|nr:hypothetical protein [Bryobacteraceae bacterium]